MRINQILQALLRDNRGATAVEYGLILGLIVIVIITAMSSVADENTGLWAFVTSNMNSVM